MSPAGQGNASRCNGLDRLGLSTTKPGENAQGFKILGTGDLAFVTGRKQTGAELDLQHSHDGAQVRFRPETGSKKNGAPGDFGLRGVREAKRP